MGQEGPNVLLYMIHNNNNNYNNNNNNERINNRVSKLRRII